MYACISDEYCHFYTAWCILPYIVYRTNISTFIGKHSILFETFIYYSQSFCIRYNYAAL